MKRRIGITVAMIGVTLLFGLPLHHAQQPQPTPTPCVDNHGPAPSVPARPSLPARSSGPAQPSVPAVPVAGQFGDVIFAPDLIMRRGRELELTGEQKSFMSAEIQKTTARFNELKWQLQEAIEVLHETLKSNSVNDEQAMSQLDKVLEVEREVKRLHFGMGLRIKNQLTPEQQDKLRARMARNRQIQ